MSDAEETKPTEGQQEQKQEQQQEQKEKQDNGGRQTARSDKTGQSSGQGTPRDGKKQQKEYFKEELKRLKDSLQKESSTIQKPPVKDHTPYCFNTLEPYYNTYTPFYLIDLPEQERHGYVSRQTAIGLCDPWVNHKMDIDMLPKIESRPVVAQDTKEQKKGGGDKKKEGSTRLPKFPVVRMSSEEVFKRKIFYSDVPQLRQELKKKYGDQAQTRIDQEYKRTKDDFYRMDLDKMEAYHPLNRPNMRKTYFAYLQNNAGSKKAVYECVKEGKKSEKAS